MCDFGIQPSGTIFIPGFVSFSQLVHKLKMETHTKRHGNLISLHFSLRKKYDKIRWLLGLLIISVEHVQIIFPTDVKDLIVYVQVVMKAFVLHNTRISSFIFSLTVALN
jgi:hypothetical protein